MKTTSFPLSGDCAAPREALCDRWLEGDFRFFDKENPRPDAAAFFERFAGFYSGAQEGEAGIMLNVGWFADVVLAYPGDLDAPIPLAVFKPLCGENSGETLGDDVWTYRQIAGVVDAIRAAARQKLGRDDFRVGLLLLGWTSIYYAHSPVWFNRHRESFRWSRYNRTDSPSLYLDWSSRLKPDPARYAAYPDGIPQATPLPEFFAAQWARFSKDTGFDTINLRDGMLGLANYRHASPSWDPACFEGIRTLLREIKRLSPRTLTMGYSVAGSAMAELRCHSFDLRTLARDGCLDVWITQSWGCNWIEQKRLELTPPMQLATILTHRALLEGTGVKHYVLFNMLDAYEFLTLKPFRHRWEALKWEIWAYTHGALVRNWDPEGTWGLREGRPLSLASGIYGSWFHVRKDLLDASSADLFAGEINRSVQDARALQLVGGPEFVLNDDWVRALNFAPDPHAYTGENVDEAVGFLIRGGVPVLSICRILERNFLQAQNPLILHHPFGIPLDIVDEIRSNPGVKLVIGPDAAGFVPESNLWDTAEKLDPLGDGRVLRHARMPEEAAPWVEALRCSGPSIDAPASACVHFHYWLSAGGSWQFLLGNVEAGAGDVRFNIHVPCEWLGREQAEKARLIHPDQTEVSRSLARDAVIWSLELKANTSVILKLQ